MVVQSISDPVDRAYRHASLHTLPRDTSRDTHILPSLHSPIHSSLPYRLTMTSQLLVFCPISLTRHHGIFGDHNAALLLSIHRSFCWFLLSLYTKL